MTHCNPFRRAAWNRKPVLEPMQRYERGDTSAATARIAELRKEELKGDTKAAQQRAYMRSYRNSLPVPSELITPPEVLASHWKPAMFHAVCEGVDAKPIQPAASGWHSRQQRLEAPFRSSRCCYPIGDPGHPDFRHCGVIRHGVGPYCATHHALTHLKTAPLRID